MALTFRQRIINLQGNLMSFAVQLTHNKEEAEDLLQDTTLKVLDNEDKYTENTNFKGWAFTIMRNIFINNYRRQARCATVIDRTQDLYHINQARDPGLDTPDGSYAAGEISSVIGSFDEGYRLPFTMHVAGYKYSEIAERMNLPVGTVKSRIFFARRRLQALLKDYRAE